MSRFGWQREKGDGMQDQLDVAGEYAAGDVMADAVIALDHTAGHGALMGIK
jgi:hypothetical protein